MNIGKIIGLPIRVSTDNRVSIPQEYLHLYGISTVHDKIMLHVKAHSISVSLLKDDPMAKCHLAIIRNGNFHLPTAWIKQNNVHRGDYVFILGLADRLVLYIR